MENQIFTKYYQFRKEVDELESQLSSEHSQHLQCKKGCDMCCMDYSIFPVEFYSIRQELKEKNSPPTKIHLSEKSKENGSCVFLVNHQCQIYKSRPTICRTHGLPLLYTNNEGEWELSACELNFAEFEDEFSESNTFPQDKYNSKLFLINKEFIKNFKEKKYNEMDLIPIKNLASFLK